MHNQDIAKVRRMDGWTEWRGERREGGRNDGWVDRRDGTEREGVRNAGRKKAGEEWIVC
jgi:hypothetical protein